MTTDWPVPERPREAWDPFMRGLFLQIRKERRRRLLARITAAACLLMALWAGFGLGTAGRGTPLLAEVPTTEAPIFQPDADPGQQAPIVLVCAR